MADEKLMNIKNEMDCNISINGQLLAKGQSGKCLRSQVNEKAVSEKRVTLTEITEEQIADEGVKAQESIDALVAKIKADPKLLDAEKDFTGNGLPKVNRLEDIGGFDVDGDIRDEVWAEVKSLYPDA